MSLEFPSGPVPLNSGFYINRSPVEDLAYQEIDKPGSLIRIKAPKQMGKTSLVLRLIDYAQQINYHTVYVDFLKADETIFNSLDKFLRWFCANISLQLGLRPMLDDYWDEDIGSKVSCTLYLQGYLLENIQNPLVLALNEVNRIFEYPKIAQDFLSLLRSWYEEAKQIEIFQKLRLVVVHSTEVYITLNIHQSPFNIGLPIKLPEFSLEQVQDLANRYGLAWTEGTQAKKLMAMVGGHPQLVQLALYHLINAPPLLVSQGDTVASSTTVEQKESWENLDQLLAEAPTSTGIYSEHLRELLVMLQDHPELTTALKSAIATPEGVKLDPIAAYKLESLGLVKLDGDRCTLTCELYRLFLSSQNLEGEDLREQLVQLQKQNQELQRLRYLDDLTQVAKRHYCDQYLEQQWKRLSLEQAPLSLILCDIDYLRVYNNTCGYEAGNNCLRQVAIVIRQLVSRSDDLAARYEDDKFALILPTSNAFRAFSIAESLRENVKKLAISHDSQIGGLPATVITVSTGVACTIPHLEDSPSLLVQAANNALIQAKRQGGDSTFISSTFAYGLLDN
ncbi:MAG TPA: AAA-like domain-containing protein [Cyanophyceae cyanobacterium]